jgi:hypothetical protein
LIKQNKLTGGLCMTDFEIFLREFFKSNLRQTSKIRFVTEEQLEKLDLTPIQYSKLFNALNILDIKVLKESEIGFYKKANLDYFSFLDTIPKKDNSLEDLLNEYLLSKKDDLKSQIIDESLSLLYGTIFLLACNIRIPMEELLSYGFEGLIIAIDSYERCAKHNFSIYAKKVICGHVLLEVSKEKHISMNLFKELYTSEDLLNLLIQNDSSLKN